MKRNAFHPGYSCNPAGFTLIELLVVVAIISLLASILIPSLQKAKELAKVSLCSAQLHSWGVIHTLYAHESNGTLKPFFLSAGNRADWGSPEVLSHPDYIDFFMEKYDATKEMYFCPLKPAFLDFWYLGGSEAWLAGPYARTGYTYIAVYPGWASNFFLNGNVSPSTLEQSESWWVYMTDVTRDYGDEFQTNHWFGGNFGCATLSVDGHVEHNTNDLEVQFQLPSNPGYCIWWKHTR